MLMLAMIAITLLFIVYIYQNNQPVNTDDQFENYKIEDHRPQATLIYDDNNRPLAEYFLETLGNSDSVSTKLVKGSPAPTLIIKTKKDSTIIRYAIRTAINDLV